MGKGGVRREGRICSLAIYETFSSTTTTRNNQDNRASPTPTGDGCAKATNLDSSSEVFVAAARRDTSAKCNGKMVSAHKMKQPPGGTSGTRRKKQDKDRREVEKEMNRKKDRREGNKESKIDRKNETGSERDGDRQTSKQAERQSLYFCLPV